MLAALQALGGVPSFAAVILEHADLTKVLGAFDAFKVATSCGALLTVPQLHSNSLRIEALAHLAVYACRGSKKPQPKQFAQWYAALGAGRFGHIEDPAEDVFVGSVATRRGNFRILAGAWEAAAFYLQRIVNVVEDFPASGPLSEYRESVYALLKLSDAVCERATLSRHELGNSDLEATLPLRFSNTIDRLRKRVVFSATELRELGIPINALAQFIFDPSQRDVLRGETFGHTSLERHPIVVQGGYIGLALPTTVSAAIRRSAVEVADGFGVRKLFLENLALDYSKLLSAAPKVGEHSAAPVNIKSMPNKNVSSILLSVDKGRYLHCVYCFDELEGFSRDGLLGSNPDPEGLGDEIAQSIDWAHAKASEQPDFRDGLTLVVICGIGRSVRFASEREWKAWRQDLLAAPDFLSLSWLPGMSPLFLWRLLDGVERLAECNATLQNASGLLNLAAWSRANDGHLVPHHAVPVAMGSDDTPNFIIIEQNALRQLRHEALTHWDVCAVQDVKEKWHIVRKLGSSPFVAERKRPLYAREELEGGDPSCVFLAVRRPWWATTRVDKGVDRSVAFNTWQMMSTWLSRIAPVLDEALKGLPPGPVRLHTTFKGSSASIMARSASLSLEEAKSEITVNVSNAEKTVSLVVSTDFEAAHHNESNVAERAIVCRAVDGFVELAGAPVSELERTAIVEQIVPNDRARQTHRFMQREFRDHMLGVVSPEPILLDRMDGATSKLGLGWRARDRKLGGDIVGKAECSDFLNSTVRLLEDDLCSDLRRFNREATITRALLNHESAAVSKDSWERTASAMLALQEDKRAAAIEIANHGFKLNAVFSATRLLIEFALCECPLEGGLEPGDLDLTRLMSEAASISAYGGWSDAIRWDAIEPLLRVRPLGDIHANVGSLEQIVENYARASSDLFLDEAVSAYGQHLQDVDISSSVESLLEAEFLSAWSEEFGASLDNFRRFIDCIEDIGVKTGRAILRLPKSQLLALTHQTKELGLEVTAPLVESLSFPTRASWREIPEGYDDKDRQPWRFRRRLTVLRKPLIQIDQKDDPTILVAPGMLRDALGFMLSGYHRGDFPDWQLKRKMRRWAGGAGDRRGKKFTHEVAQQLTELGWKNETEVPITKLLGMSFDKDYGDVDILAWRPDSGRVLIIECKHVQFRKTYGEISEQLADFRGELKANGKPDYLLLHLNRVELLSQHSDKVRTYVGLAKPIQAESHLVFKYPVPMQFALRRLKARVSVHTAGQLVDAFHFVGRENPSGLRPPPPRRGRRG